MHLEHPLINSCLALIAITVSPCVCKKPPEISGNAKEKLTNLERIGDSWVGDSRVSWTPINKNSGGVNDYYRGMKVLSCT